MIPPNELSCPPNVLSFWPISEIIRRIQKWVNWDHSAVIWAQFKSSNLRFRNELIRRKILRPFGVKCNKSPARINLSQTELIRRTKNWPVSGKNWAHSTQTESIRRTHELIQRQLRSFGGRNRHELSSFGANWVHSAHEPIRRKPWVHSAEHVLWPTQGQDFGLSSFGGRMSSFGENIEIEQKRHKSHQNDQKKTWFWTKNNKNFIKTSKNHENIWNFRKTLKSNKVARFGPELIRRTHELIRRNRWNWTKKTIISSKWSKKTWLWTKSNKDFIF